MSNRNIFFFLLLPFSWIYGLIVFMRNKLFDFGILPSEEFDIPVISVGNISVGGTGKTPHIEYLIRLLKDEFSVATLSRGYKRKTKGFIIAGDNPDAETLGDEPCQLKQKFQDIIVAVDANRRNGIRKLLSCGKKIDLILLDDAFQHRYVSPGLSILLIDYNRPLHSDYLLPAGRLREPASGKERADILLISKSPQKLKPIERRIIVKDTNLHTLQYLYFTTVNSHPPLPVFPKDNTDDPELLKSSNLSLLMVSGIANPRDLKRFARSLSTRIKELYFPDHHNYSASDMIVIQEQFQSLEGEEKILITTEKDAVRFQKYSDLPENFKNRMFYIPISIDFLNEDAENFNKQVLSYVRDNKRNSILHKGKDEISA
ncbi:MAG: tetraacyldisaccharide 4'-kinase [Bacteroidales bacterium]|nr:tetraacyldisaccharide 4'-kinase [Bacteroidales bacterium]MCB9012622.1 tetraacyldisaccharide 4'-kinase [Bacteroidales bacterium]